MTSMGPPPPVDAPPRFISVWQREPSMRLTINTAAIAIVHPHTDPDGEFRGSEVKMIDGEVYVVDESTMTITARLGVLLINE